MKSKKGFTLIELLIVITIIGILAVAFLPSLLGAPAKARDTQRITALQKIATVLSTKSLTGTLPTGTCIQEEMDGNPAAKELNVADFGGKIPVDPSGTTFIVNAGTACNGMYAYVKNPAAANTYAFGIYAHVENAANGNFVCDPLTGAITTPLNLPVAAPITTGAANTQTNCYGILVQ